MKLAIGFDTTPDQTTPAAANTATLLLRDPVNLGALAVNATGTIFSSD